MGFHKDLTGSDLHAPSNQLVENNSGSTIVTLRAIKFDGLGSVYPQIVLANGATDPINGIVQSSILTGSTGYVATLGLLSNVDTSAWAVGTELYAGASGVLSATPSGTAVATVLKQHASTGVLYVTCVNSEIDIPIADASTTGLLSNTDWIDFNSRQYPVANTLYVSQNPDLGPQDYATIEDALDAVVGNSQSNPFKIIVGPGVYVEDTLAMKSWVWVEGSEQDQTIIEVDATNKHVVEGADNSGISKCTLQGATDAGFAAIHYASTTGTTNTAFWAEDVRFGENDTLIISDGTSASTAVFIEECKFGGTHSFNHGFLAEVGGRIVIRNCTTTGMTAPYPDFVAKATGSGSQIVMNAVQIRNNGLSGTCIQVADQGRLRCMSVNVNGFAVGVLSENTGGAPSLQMEAIIFENCTTDLQIDHPGTSGSFCGSVDFNKVTIDPNAPLGIGYTNTGGSGIGEVVVGFSMQGGRHDRLINISKLVREGSTMGVVSGGQISIDSGLDIDVEEGDGFLIDPTFLFVKEINWIDSNLSIPANSTRYIYVDTNGIVQQAAAPQSLITTIPLGRVSTNSTDIIIIESTEMPESHVGNKIELFLRNLGPIYLLGSIVTESGTRNLDITAGFYNYGVNILEFSADTAFTFNTLYRDGLGGWTEGTGTTVDNAFYDDGSGTLAAIPAGEYAAHTLYGIGLGEDGDGTEKYFLVYPQDTFATLAEAQEAPTPIVPSYISGAVTRIASVIVQQGSASLPSIIDLRPRIGFAAPAGTAVTNHGDLTGLLADDHPQYLLADGTRALTGPLDLGTNNIINVGTVDGVTVSAHASRHLPTGADPLTTAAPSANLSATTTNAVGIANSLSRSDHGHAISTGTASTISNNTNATGSGANLARADHTHQLTVGSPTSGQAPVWDGSNWQATDITFNPSTRVEFYDDFMGSDQTALAAASREISRGWRVDNPGGVSAAAYTGVGVAGNHPGVLEVTSGSAGGNYCDLRLTSGVALVLGGGVLACEFLIQIPTLSDATNEYIQRWGLGDTSGADQVNGVYFEYDRLTSGNVFRIRTASASTRTTTVTATAVAAATWYKLRIVVNAAASSVEFFINGVSVGTIATNIPTATLSPFMHSVRSAGAARSFKIDYFYISQAFTTPR